MPPIMEPQKVFKDQSSYTVNSALYPQQPQNTMRLGDSLVAPKGSPDSPDYDIAGYIKKYGMPDQSKGQHLTDEYKLPNHITFSNQSIYHSPETQGGVWEQGGINQYAFTPSPYNLSQHSPEKMANYFSNFERKGTFLNLPNGSRIEGSR